MPPKPLCTIVRCVCPCEPHGRDHGDAGLLVELALSAITNTADFLADGATEDELGLTTLREVAARRLARHPAWWWTYRVVLAAK